MSVRVNTRRGQVVLASDAAHLYANMEQQRPFPILYNLGDMLEGWKKLHRLADSPQHIVPGHDPLVMQRYEAAPPGMEDLASSEERRVGKACVRTWRSRWWPYH